MNGRIFLTDILTKHHITLWEQDKIVLFRQTLLNWYDNNKRDLPWRRTNDPYAIWVSEIMLQQTQVVTVIPYFTRFMSLFPTIEHLANAPEDVLLKTWEGLGYYSRVRNMQTAAKQIMTQFNGKMPNNYKDILSLKGIGTYTAGAIASIAFGLPIPAVDGNVMRIMARLFEINLDIGEAKNKKVFEYLVSQLIDPKRPGDFNQALMDLGSDICSAKNPKPELSPLKSFNQAYQNGTMHIYPIKAKKSKPVDVFYHAYVIENNKGDILLQQRQNNGLLANMWLFPLVEVANFNETTNTVDTANINKTKDLPVMTISEDESGVDDVYIGEITHIFSHLKWHIKVYKRKQHNFEGVWVNKADLKRYPLPTPQQKMMRLL